MQRRQEEQQGDTPGGMLGNVQQAHNRSQASENQMGPKRRKHSESCSGLPDISEIERLIKKREYSSDEVDRLVELIVSLEKEDIDSSDPVEGIDRDTIDKVAKLLISESINNVGAGMDPKIDPARNKPGLVLKSLLEVVKLRFLSCAIEEAKAERMRRRDSCESENETMAIETEQKLEIKDD